MRTRGTYAKSLRACPHHVLARPEQCAYPRVGARRDEETYSDAVAVLDLPRAGRRARRRCDGVRGCPRRCEEIQSDSGVICCRFYWLECDHYCANHIDHTCCRCRAMKSLREPPETASVQ